MTPIPIPAEVATCERCGGPIKISDIWEATEFPSISLEFDCDDCDLADGCEGGVDPYNAVIAWIIRKLTQGE